MSILIIRIILIVPTPRPLSPPHKPLNLIIQLPKSCRPSRPMRIIIFVEPIPQYSSRTLQPTNLYTFRAPPLFTMEDGEGRPADREIVGERVSGGGGAGRLWGWSC